MSENLKQYTGEELHNLYLEGQFPYSQPHIRCLLDYQMEHKDTPEYEEILDFCLDHLDIPMSESKEQELDNLFTELKGFLNSEDLYLEDIDNTKTISSSPKKKWTNKFRKKIIATSCCLVLFIIATVNAKGSFVSNVINIVENQVGISRNIIYPEDANEVATIELPEEYMLVNKVEVSDDISNLTKLYYKNHRNEDVTLSIEQYKKTINTRTETDGNVTTFEHNSQTYYTASNKKINLITWNSKNYYYILYGTVSIEQLKSIITNTNGG